MAMTILYIMTITTTTSYVSHHQSHYNWQCHINGAYITTLFRNKFDFDDMGIADFIECKPIAVMMMMMMYDNDERWWDDDDLLCFISLNLHLYHYYNHLYHINNHTLSLIFTQQRIYHHHLHHHLYYYHLYPSLTALLRQTNVHWKAFFFITDQVLLITNRRR